MAKRKAKHTRREPARRKARLQATGLYSLPDHLIKAILRWIRPEDMDQRHIWRWVCRISATCAAFRRVVAPLTPTILLLDSMAIYNLKATMKLMNTIRRSDWLGTNILSLQTGGFFNSEDYDATVDAFMSLLTTSGMLPNLKDVRLTCSFLFLPILPYRKSFLRDLAQKHPGLTRLTLTGEVLGSKKEDYLSPRVFARLASSLPNLEWFEISAVHWLDSNHLVAFFSNVGSKLTYLHLSGGNRRNGFTGNVFESIAANCHNLKTLRVMYCSIPSREFNSILRSNRSLLHVDVRDSNCDHAQVVFDSIVEHVPRLHSFVGNSCDWVDGHCILRLINGQFNTFGHILLAELGLSSSGVSIHGMRSILTRWREVSHLPRQVGFSFHHFVDATEEAVNTLMDDFPEVIFYRE